MTSSRRAPILFAIVIAALGAVPAGAAPPPQPKKGAIEPKADQMLHQMADYISGLKSFRLQAQAIDEVVLKSGQKIQYATESTVSVERPNKLRSEQLESSQGLAFWYDGKTMTLGCKADMTYVSAPAPPTLDATIDEARKKFEIDAPGADLLYSKPYDILTEQVTGGRFVGRESINGIAANHLAFTGEKVDWQIWIQDGPAPLPLRYVITTKDVKNQPEFRVQMSHWDPNAQLTDATFEFHAPAGAKQVPSMKSCGASAPGSANK